MFLLESNWPPPGLAELITDQLMSQFWGVINCTSEQPVWQCCGLQLCGNQPADEVGYPRWRLTSAAVAKVMVRWSDTRMQADLLPQMMGLGRLELSETVCGFICLPTNIAIIHDVGHLLMLKVRGQAAEEVTEGIWESFFCKLHKPES